jgi:hypothetical protein
MPRITFALLASLAVVCAGCEGRPLTGPDAQRAFTRAVPLFRDLPSGTLVFINGAPLAPGNSLASLDPGTITSIEVVKGAAARQRYGKDA